MRSRPLPRKTRVWTRDSASLDHRPRRISVGEITTEQKEDITEHFKVSTMKFSYCCFSKLKWIYVAQEYNKLSMVKEGHISLVRKMAFNLRSWLNPSRLLTIELIMSKTKQRFHPMSSHQKYQYQTQDGLFHVIFRHWEVVWKKGFARPTLRILDIGWSTAWNFIQKCIASLTNKKFWRNLTLKFMKSYEELPLISKPLSK